MKYWISLRKVSGDAFNVDCSDHFHSTYPDTGNLGADVTTSHSWYFSDDTFHQDLAITLKGSIDRSVIPTRTNLATPGPQRLPGTQILK
jgi:hypothetical protein